MRYLTAMRTASIAASKHCDGVDAAITGYRALAVPAEEHHQQVGLLGLRRHPGRGPGALDVEDHERQLERDRETDRLRLQHDAGAGGRRDPERAAERRADRRADRRDLVLGLERDDAELLLAGELLEDRRGRRDRVGAEEERQPGELRRGDQAEGERAVARDLAVGAGRELRRARPRTRPRSPRTSRRSSSRRGTPSCSPRRSRAASRTSSR